MDDLLQAVGEEMLDNYIARYEAGAVQSRPRLRFVDAEGRACPAVAFAGARSGQEFADSPHFSAFLGSALEGISRRFEAGRLSPSELYRDCLLERARRRDGDRRREDVRPEGRPAGVIRASVRVGIPAG